MGEVLPQRSQPPDRLPLYEVRSLTFTQFTSRVQGRCSYILQRELRRHRLFRRHKRWRAALTIQRFARGFLERRRRDSLLLECKRAEARYSLYALAQQTEECLLQVGRDLTEAAALLQRNVRLFLFRRKLHYLGL